MNKSDYQNKMQQMINDAIHDDIYKVTVDNTLDDFKTFKFSIPQFLWEGRTNHPELLKLINLTVLRI